METAKEKILIGGIQKFSTDDGPGIRTTVFLKGCPLNCKWCHNPELISPRQEVIRMPNSCIHCGYCIEHCHTGAIYVNEDKEIDLKRASCDLCMECVKNCFAEGLRAVGKLMSAEEVMREVIKDKPFYDSTGGGMTISGGELLMHADFAMELCQLALQNDIKVCLDTSGCGDSEALKALASMPNVSDILYDMKCIDSTRHKALTGLSNELILNNLIMLAEDETIRHKLHMRMPLVTGLNDDYALMEETADFYKQHRLQRVTLLPYHPLGVSKMKHVGGHQESYAPPEDEYLERLCKLFNEKAGMNAVISSISKK